jgi:hypothetical protein
MTTTKAAVGKGGIGGGKDSVGTINGWNIGGVEEFRQSRRLHPRRKH